MTRDELQKILDEHEKWVKGVGGERAVLHDADLRWADLRGRTLRGADLSRVDLYGADLRGTDLRGATLRGADLREVDLRWADLREVDLYDANLRWADLRASTLRGADLSRVNLRGANLREVDLRGVNLCGTDLRGTDLRGADLSGARNLYLLPVQDPRGYSWPHAVQCDDGVWRIRAGRRFFTIAEAREHWGPSYAGERRIGDMYLAAIDWLERVIAEDATINKVQGGEG